MSKTQLHQFAFGPNDFVNAVDTGLPGLWAVVCNGIVMVARRGGVWYEPRGNEAQAAVDALSLSLDGKYVCVDGHAVEDICGQCEKNIRDCQCQEEAEDEEPSVKCPQCKGRDQYCMFCEGTGNVTHCQSREWLVQNPANERAL